MQRIRVAEWGIAEYRALLACFAFGRQDRGPEFDALKARLGAIYGGRRLLFINRGRHALEIALRTFAECRPGRPEVIFPAYICPSVIEAIERAGLTPVAADIREDLNIDPAEVKAHLSGRTLAVVAAHMYGCPAPIEEIEALCQRHGVFLIDDAAQLAGVSIGDRIAGCFGDCGLVSFSLSKTIVAGSVNAGGFLIVNNPELEALLQRRWDALPEGRYSLDDFASFLTDGPLYTLASPVDYYAQEIWRRFIKVGRRQGSRGGSPRHMANANAALALHQLDSMGARIGGRIRVMTAFQQQFRQHGVATLPQYLPDRYRTRVMAMLPRGLDAARLRRLLDRRGVQTRLGYEVRSLYSGRSLRAADASARLIELPSHSHMAQDEIERIVTKFIRAVG